MKKVLILSGVGIGLVLAAFAFVAGPGLWAAESVAATDSGERIMEIAIEDVEVIDGETTVTSGTVQVSFDDAGQLPAGPPIADGIFLNQDGDELSLGTGNIEVSVEIEQVNDQEPVMAVSAVHSGDAVAVTVAEGATIYLETTANPEPTAADIEAGEMVMSRSFEAGSLADLAENMMVQAWGTEDGGSLVADVLVLTPIK